MEEKYGNKDIANDYICLNERQKDKRPTWIQKLYCQTLFLALASDKDGIKTWKNIYWKFGITLQNSFRRRGGDRLSSSQYRGKPIPHEFTQASWRKKKEKRKMLRNWHERQILCLCNIVQLH